MRGDGQDSPGIVSEAHVHYIVWNEGYMIMLLVLVAILVILTIVMSDLILGGLALVCVATYFLFRYIDKEDPTS